ncbi:MAG: hypothetical protein K0R49_924, partial [Burkholderiales bacterium]|nr:hypothetical protein [Burkholderiales bacterium]
MKIYKLNRYIIGLFSISFLCINASQANEIGIGIIKLPNGPAQNYLLPKDEEKDALGGEDSEKKQIKIEWQITDNQINQDRPKVTSTILHGEKSYIYKGSEVFTDGKVPELVSFAGVYQLDNSKSAIAYKFERITAGTGYRWRLTYIDPIDTTTKEGQKRLLTNP